MNEIPAENIQEQIPKKNDQSHAPTQRDVLIDRLEYFFSKKQVFVRGIISGIGAAIGATVFAGVVIAILFQFLGSIERVPLVGNLARQIINTAEQYRNIDTQDQTISQPR